MSSSRPIITLTTDFGATDPYAGVMKGVISGINPDALLVDLTHDVEPQNVLQGAFLLGSSYRFFPPRTIHLVVVDPGVGSSRRPILLDTSQGRFIAPDNGVLSYVLKDGGAQTTLEEESHQQAPEGHRAYHLTNSSFWLHPLSPTFHGRDVFAPVAGHLSLGVPPLELGEEIPSLTCLSIASPEWHNDRLPGKVVHVDRFGNLITNISAGLLDQAHQIAVEAKGRRIGGLSAYYAQATGLLAIIGSYNTLEIAVRNGSAAAELDAHIGDAVVVLRHSDT